jgi:maltose alpha-D-glucosyltransferase/alpha-amylase
VNARLWPPDGPVYGVDLPRFADSDGDGFGDLPGLIERLDYLEALGVSWIWLLPFYASGRRDNGYDVDDHQTVDPRYGDLEDFDRLVGECHRRGMSMMIDLVIHPTSDRHRWFRLARRDRGGRYGRYYVWADEPVEVPGDANVFKGEENSVWEYDDLAKGWYHHQFYAFQPDLNLANPDVFEEIVEIGTFWLERGVDGFRLDAAVPAVTSKPTDGTGVEEKQFFSALRARLAAVRKDVVLMGEADVSPEAMAPLVRGPVMDAVLDFALNNAVFLSLARESPGPVHDTLERLNRVVDAAARVTFMRNADELDLEQLSDDERKEAFAAFAPDPEMLVYGRGLRRGWAPMMGSPKRFRMTLSLLFALPGLPLILQGQELGIGDDLEAEGRNAARPTMQWDAGPAGGFSSRVDSPLILPRQRSGDYDFGRVNVRDQESDERSPLALTRILSRLRADWQLGAAQGHAFPIPGTPSVLALRTGDVLTLHNLGRTSQRVRVEAPDAALLAESWHGDSLGPYGFVWMRPDRMPAALSPRTV